MKKLFIIDGGAGRVVASIPAFMKRAKAHPGDDWYVFVYGFDILFWGIPELQDRTYNPDTKGVFDNIALKVDKIITPEPYRNVRYLRQEISLAEAFDEEINDTLDHSDLAPPMMKFTQNELLIAQNTIGDVKAAQKKPKTIMIQPFGRGAKINDRKQIFDEESRSLSVAAYINLTKRLAARYNMIFFGDPEFQLKEDTFTGKYTTDLRQWAALIKACDYFVGVDSVGQHFARTVGTPGTVIFGSTFPINTSYPDYFQIIQKEGIKKFAPIRISGFETQMANRINEGLMSFNDLEVTEIFNKIVAHIEKKK